MTSHQFQLVAGDPALNFLNTIHDWTAAEPRDYLTHFDEAVRFGDAAGLLTRAELITLSGRSSRGELRRLRELRARLERIFRAFIDSRAPDAADLDALGRDAAAAARTASLRAVEGQMVRRIDVETAGVATLRWRVVEAAVSLLTSPGLHRVKACPACGWFMRDETKNGSRRWCSMKTCGSSAKSRRYYWRTKLGSPNR